MRYFTKDFWKMTVGFSLIVGLGLLGMHFLNASGLVQLPGSQPASAIEAER